MKKLSIYLSLLLLLILVHPGMAQKSVWWKLPELPAPERYGNIIIDRASTDAGVKPVTFSHWSHRVTHNCRVCHFELEFDMMVNTTFITEEENKHGRYCGACHNDKIAFGHTEDNCEKCHNGNIDFGKEKFSGLSGLARAVHGNEVDWVKAYQEKQIKPENYVLEEEKPIQFDRDIIIESPWAGISPVIFPHQTHGDWLDCSNCHPDIFNIKQYATDDLSMENILNYEFCGVCHGRVAFPPNDNCKRCHPKMKHPGKSLQKAH